MNKLFTTFLFACMAITSISYACVTVDRENETYTIDESGCVDYGRK